MGLIPLRDVVIIEKDKVDETDGGIVLLDSHKDPAGTDTGTVLYMRSTYINTEGFRREQNDVKPGQRVLFLRKHGIAIKGSKTQVCVRYENLLAVYED